ncbi:PAS domain-containing protein, partial [Escherichia coli]|uniref:PAS domain-containing protein n=1 Tax=Escherichia coli TaxID=562 RepID=UPI0028DE5DCF
SSGDWEWDRSTGTMTWSEQTRKLFGVDSDEPIGLELFRQLIHPDDRERRDQAIERAWETGVFANEYRIVRDDGEVRWMSSRG